MNTNADHLERRVLQGAVLTGRINKLGKTNGADACEDSVFTRQQF